MSAQIHGRSSFDRSPNTPGIAIPSLQIQFHAPARFEQIRGPYQFSFQLEAPAIVWGRHGQCWAFLHDFDLRSVNLILSDCRQATSDRRGRFFNPFGVC